METLILVILDFSLHKLEKISGWTEYHILSLLWWWEGKENPKINIKTSKMISSGLQSKLYLRIETMILLMLRFHYLQPNMNDRNALFPFVFNSYTRGIWWSVQHYFLSWLSRKPLCIRYILFLTSCELWGYGYTLSTGTLFSFSFFLYDYWILIIFLFAWVQICFYCFFDDLADCWQLSFSLFYLQHCQQLSRIFLFKIENGELLDWEGFQYFMQLTRCRKLPTLFLLEKSSISINKTYQQ